MFDNRMKALMVIGIMIAVAMLPLNQGDEPLTLASNPKTPPASGSQYSDFLGMVPLARGVTLEDWENQNLVGDTCPMRTAIAEYYAANDIVVETKHKDKLQMDACALPLQLQIPVAQIIYAITEAGDVEKAQMGAVGAENIAAIRKALTGSLDSDHASLASKEQPFLEFIDQSASVKAAYSLLSAIEQAKPLLVEYQNQESTSAGKLENGNGNDDAPIHGGDSSDLIDDASGIIPHQIVPTDAVLFSDPTGLFIIGGSSAANYVGAWNPQVDVPTVNQDVASVLTIDLGGDDTYGGRAGGGNGLPVQLGGDGIPVSVVIDLGGNDYYDGSENCQGAGDTAIGILIDSSGNDRYNAGSHCQGSGRLAGVGIFIDELGSDYRSAGTESQGSGLFRGVGLLVDLDGSDEYWATSAAQGYAWGGYGVSDQRAVGIVLDYTGNDYYNLSICCGRGYTVGSAASGWFVDKGGLDQYLTHVAANGLAWDTSGNALFVDEGTEQDVYSATDYICPCGNNKIWTQGAGEGRGVDGPSVT
ncbi:MAG: hypothetical protein HY556_08045 [Euryarchaeota archaeon]|nr:hypothetical protein [Euryarchaeota archaeon]